MIFVELISGFVISREIFSKKDMLYIFSKQKGKIKCSLSISKSYFRRIEVGDYCQLDVSNRYSDFFIVTGCNEIKTNMSLRKCKSAYVYWSFLSEIIKNCFEEGVPYIEVYFSLEKFINDPAKQNFQSIFNLLVAKSGVGLIDEPILNKIRHLESSFEIQIKSKEELLAVFGSLS